MLSSFEYDASGQLTDADHASQTDETYTYNTNGSRSMTGYTTSTNNRTTAMPGFTFSYDDEGNRTRKTQTSNGHVQDYEWDHRNRLTFVKFRNSVGGSITKQVDYEYDAFNRLVKRTYDADGAGGGSATNQYWVYDEGINAVLQFDENAASNLSHRYLWSDKVDQLLADEQVTSLGSGGNVLWALSDHLGTIRDIADFDESTGITAIANHRKYNAFGALISETNSAVDLIYGFTGKQLDEATYLQHNLNRWYDSALAQWLSEDPIGLTAGDENLRRYVKNHVFLYIDSNGLEAEYTEEMGWEDKIAYEGYMANKTRQQDLHDGGRVPWTYQGSQCVCSDRSYMAAANYYHTEVTNELPDGYSINFLGVSYSRSKTTSTDKDYGNHAMLYIGNTQGGYLVDPTSGWTSEYTASQEIGARLAELIWEKYLPVGSMLKYISYNFESPANSSFGLGNEYSISVAKKFLDDEYKHFELTPAYFKWQMEQRKKLDMFGKEYDPSGTYYGENPWT